MLNIPVSDHFHPQQWRERTALVSGSLKWYFKVMGDPLHKDSYSLRISVWQCRRYHPLRKVIGKPQKIFVSTVCHIKWPNMVDSPISEWFCASFHGSMGTVGKVRPFFLVWLNANLIHIHILFNRSLYPRPPKSSFQPLYVFAWLLCPLVEFSWQARSTSYCRFLGIATCHPRLPFSRH